MMFSWLAEVMWSDQTPGKIVVAIVVLRLHLESILQTLMELEPVRYVYDKFMDVYLTILEATKEIRN